MTQHFSGDLFAVQNQTPVPLSSRLAEANARLVRAKNAALQRPLSYLDVSRHQFSNEEKKLFEEISPIQVAQFFLEKISDAMIFGTVITTSEIKRLVTAYVADLDFRRSLTEEQHALIVEKTVNAIRNSHDDYSKFRERIRNEVTGEEIEFAFELVTVHSTLATGREEFVYKLTQEGVKLLHITWQAPDNFDMYSVMIETAIASGKWSEAAAHIDRCLHSSNQIEATFGEIELKLRQQSYDKDFDDELRLLIDKVEQDAQSFGQLAKRQAHLIKLGDEAEALDEETRGTLARIATNIRQLQRIHARFTKTIADVLQAFRRLQAQQIADLGTRHQVPDITIDYLQRLAVLPAEYIHGSGLADLVPASILLAKRPTLFDPFVIWENARLADEENPDVLEEDEPVISIVKSRRTTIAEMTVANGFIDKALRKFGRDGIRLSEVFRLMENQGKLSDYMRFLIAHRAAFVGQRFRGLKIEKINDGTRLVDCPYMNGPDLILKVI